MDDVELVNKFDDDRKQKVVEENYDSFKSRFRGQKTVTLKKDGNWLIVPSGQEKISSELGLQDVEAESLVEEQEQVMQEPERLDSAIMLKVMNITIFLDATKSTHIMDLIKALRLLIKLSKPNHQSN